MYESFGSCKTPFIKITNTASISISFESLSFLSNWKLTNSALYKSGNTVLTLSCRFSIGSIKSNCPNCQEANLSLNTSTTSISNGDIGFFNPFAVTNPTGWNLSPSSNAYPTPLIEKSDTSKNWAGANDFLADTVLKPIALVTIPTYELIADCTLAQPPGSVLYPTAGSAVIVRSNTWSLTV